MKNSKIIFKQGSKTFYTASLFFPRNIRRDVTSLYAFVRIADDLVDKVPQDRNGFMRFKNQTGQAFKSMPVTDTVIQNFFLLCQKYGIKKNLVDAFLSTMEQDLTKSIYATYGELEKYMYGSAEVIGLMMARILQLPIEAEKAARLQGKAMQLINFIRDVKEDLDMNRQYIPLEDLQRFGVVKLTPRVDQDAFKKLVEFEISRYKKLQEEAAKGYSYIPRASRVPIATAASLYDWTANQILKNPMVVFERKIKPSSQQIFMEYIRQFFFR